MPVAVMSDTRSGWYAADAYSGEPASTEGADPRDEGTVRGEMDVEKLAPP